VLYCDILTALDNTLSDVLHMTWPMLFISLVLISTLRIAYLFKKREEFIIYKEIFMLAFVLYILCLFQVVTSQDINMISGNNFIPFKEIFRYKFGERLFVKNIIGNVIMFIPYGFFVPIYSGIRKNKGAFTLIIFASIAIEVTQLMIGRIFDIDDILLNVLGGMLGFWFFVALDKLCGILPKFFRTNLFKNVVSIIAFLFFIVYIIWRL